MVNNSWSKKIVHWEDEKNHYYSIVFTWQLYRWSKHIQPELDGKNIIAGGPAVKLMPEIVPSWINIGKDIPSLYRHNHSATKTSTGCIRKCRFCSVPRTEGSLKELKKWEVKPVLIDNNLLACSRKHFNKVIDKLKRLKWCDFNQGLDARLMTKYHADRLAELNNPLVRLSFDELHHESPVCNAIILLRKAGIPKKNIRIYVLIGFADDPEDALYRLELIRSFGIKPNPMRYQPPETFRKNSYVHPKWTHKELDRFMSYWSNLRFTGAVPFNEYEHRKRKHIERNLFNEDTVLIKQEGFWQEALKKV
ncbi:MAG: hypothetical protein JXB88_03235 [Spirochaetales bacterium]|nr:hypothetical protein [Spirochaetales bacterium]